MNISETDGAIMSDVKPVAWHIGQNTPQREIGIHFSKYSTDDTHIEIMRTAGHRVTALYSQETVLALQAEIEALRQNVGTGRAIIVDLLDQIDSLQSYELTRDLEGYKAQAIWDSAIENAKRYAAIAKEKQQ